MSEVGKDFCRNCGAEVSASARFCGKCGHDLDENGGTQILNENDEIEVRQVKSPVVPPVASPVKPTVESPAVVSNETVSERPVGKVTFVEAIKLYFKNYANFSGRATLREYWWIVLLEIIVATALSILVNNSPELASVLAFILSLATFIPSISVGVRRLHDVGKSGINMFLALTPVTGVILMLFLARKSAGDNEWGPKYMGAK